MKKILLIGNAPLPNENTKSRPAAGLRTWQFLSMFNAQCSMCDEGRDPHLRGDDRGGGDDRGREFDAKLVTIAMPECYDQEPDYKEAKHRDGFSQIVISKDDPRLISKIQKIHDKFEPDVIVGVNTYPSFVASRLKSDACFWADLNGWIMAEAQAQAYKLDSNVYIPHYLEMERSILRRADKFSCVSRVQSACVLGELAGLGRLCNESFGYEFVEHVPNGTEWFEGERDLIKNYDLKDKDSRFRGNDRGGNDRDVPEDAFVALWMGGYNTWVDEETLFKGVEAAMAKCEKLYFVSTGGEIKGLDNKTFANFRKMIDESDYKDRFVFLGWVDTSAIPYIYKRADCGLNVDRRCVETLTGARNRINEMMKFGLPVVTTLGSEISYEAELAEAGPGVESGDAYGLSEAICSIYKEWDDGEDSRFRGNDSGRGNEWGVNGVKYIEEECNYKKTLICLEKWLKNPRVAPDRDVKMRFGLFGKISSGISYLRKNGVRKFFKKIIQRLQGRVYS